MTDEIEIYDNWNCNMEPMLAALKRQERENLLEQKANLADKLLEKGIGLPAEKTLPDDRSIPLTVKQAAARMNISTSKVYELCQQGLLKHTTNPIRILPADIDRYREVQAKQPSAGLKHLR